jgi:predicted transcriptional regulator
MMYDFVARRALDSLHRTQIYLPPELTDRLDRLARRRGTSRAALLRQAAGEFLQRELPVDDDPIMGILALGDAGPATVSEEHDRFLAGLGAVPR